MIEIAIESGNASATVFVIAIMVHMEERTSGTLRGLETLSEIRRWILISLRAKRRMDDDESDLKASTRKITKETGSRSRKKRSSSRTFHHPPRR